MKLARRADPHARFLELLSAQLHEPLRLDESWTLSVHLARCSSCRAAQRDYAEQRRALRDLPAPRPPRDLGARVSAALDREVLRRPALPSGGRVLWPAGPSLGRPTLTSTSAVVSLAVMAVGAVALLNGLPLAIPDATLLRPTPLAVPGQALAYLGAGPDGGLALYRTSVDQVCPPSAIDCVEARDEHALLALARPFLPSSLALSPSGERVAISARDADSDEDIFAVVQMPPVKPLVSTSASGTPGPTSAPATPGQAATTHASFRAGSTPPAPTAVASATLMPTPVPATPASTEEAVTMLAILEDVRGVGAPPAWSADGSMLAFSAMPADASRGPDIYVWRPGDETATPITADGASYFASWSGAYVVASRVSTPAPAADGESGASPTPDGNEELPEAIPDAGDDPFVVDPGLTVTTVQIDPLSGSAWVIDGLAVWLPQVSPLGSRAVAWRGRLEMSGAVVRAVAGGLYAFGWSQLHASATAAPSDAPAPTAGGSADPLLTLPPLVPTVPVTSHPTAQPDSTPDSPADPAPTDSAAPVTAFAPLQPGRDELADPVLDWEVRWAGDGSALGFWIADAPGAAWGSLTVVPVDGHGELALDRPLIARTLARRSFTLGNNRAAWIAPAEQTPDGELRITVWGPDGSGVLRFSDPALYRVLAAF